jgi:flagellar biosynthesis/type III secretory pathway M-ring protein FliF/YscJ
MGFFQLMVSLWPFLKEMFVGEKIKDTNASKESAAGKAQDRTKKPQFAVLAARWLMDKMQNSRRFLAIVLMVLMLSLFINYKVIGKLTAMMPRSDDQIEPTQPPAKEKKEQPTIPRPPSSERDALYEQTVRELKSLYGESRL